MTFNIFFFNFLIEITKQRDQVFILIFLRVKVENINWKHVDLRINNNYYESAQQGEEFIRKGNDASTYLLIFFYPSLGMGY